jgi:DNA (cytosine-5)-methyltransferase 1
VLEKMMEEPVLTYGTGFSGIGGLDLGFDEAGIKCLFQVEIDQNCQNVLKRRWADVPKFKDIRDVGKHNLPAIDLFGFGFPCQDLSVAGNRAGLAGERSGLWYEAHRVITEIQPRWVVIENVPGLLSSGPKDPITGKTRRGIDFAIILAGLTGSIPTIPEDGWKNAGFARGPFYNIAWRVLDAQYFGVAQRRRRVFIVASLGNGSCAQVLFESEGSAWDSPPGREAGPGFAAAITERTRDAGRQLEMQDDLAYALTNPGSGGRPHSRLIAHDVAGTLAAGAHPGSYNGRDAERGMLITQDVAATLTEHFGGASNQWPPINEADNLIAFSESGPGWWRDGIGTLRERDYKDGNTGLICNQVSGPLGNGSGKRGWKVSAENAADGHLVVANTLSTEEALRGPRGDGNDNLIAFDYCIGGSERTQMHRGSGYAQLQTRPDAIASSSIGVRRLTPVECERLQGFPDGWTEGQSDSVRYRQLGNAVCVKNAKWIGKRIIKIEQLKISTSI